MESYLSPEDVQSLEGAAQYLRDKLLIRILFHLGCRISEALAIDVKDIDFSRGSVTIEHLKARLNLYCPDCGTRLGKSHTFCPHCGEKVEKAVAKELEHKRVRKLPVDQDTLQLLRDYIKAGGPVSKNGRELLFGINRHRAWQIVTESAERAELGRLVHPESGRVHKVSPHKLRDAFAVMAMKIDDSGDGLRLLQEHLGHASFNTTAKYRKLSGQESKEWYDGLWQGR